MDEHLISVIVGGLIASIPTAISIAVSFADSEKDRRHDARKIDIEIYHRAKLDALLAYRAAYSEVCRCINGPKELSAFRAASETLDLMVCDTTHNTLIEVQRVIIAAHKDLFNVPGYRPPFQIDQALENRLLNALRLEMDSLHRSSGLKKTRSFHIRNHWFD